MLFRLLKCCLGAFCLLFVAFSAKAQEGSYLLSGFKEAPYTWQVAQAVERLKSEEASVRTSALEQLGLMRGYAAAEAVGKMLSDADPLVRREATMALGWLGNTKSIDPLIAVLSDSDWTVRQSAATALQNLTGCPFYFDALANEDIRQNKLDEWTQTMESLDIGDVALAALANPEMDYFEKADRIRAAGTFDCQKVTEPLIAALRPYVAGKYPADNPDYLYTPKSPSTDARPERAFVQAGLRTLGQLGGDDAEAFLIEMLNSNVNWACYAAEALGDCGGTTAVDALIKRLPDFTISLKHKRYYRNYDGIVKAFPKHDEPRLSPLDRIPRTVYEILFALSRLELAEHKQQLAAVMPHILATVPNTWDGTVIYTEEPWCMIYGWIFEQAGLRRQVAEIALNVLGVGELPEAFPMRDEFVHQIGKNLDQNASQHAPFAGATLLCSADRSDIPKFIELLQHDSGWIRLEAARALILFNAQEAIDPLIKLLEEAKDDVDYGYDMSFNRFKENYVRQKKLPGSGYDELCDPSPRFKEGYIRALGGLHAKQAVPLLVQYLNNDRNAIEIQHAAALALGEIATPEALKALQDAELNHSVGVVRLVALEAMLNNGLPQLSRNPDEQMNIAKQQPVPEGKPRRLVFIKGEREPGNNEQFSKDMTHYSTTDGGPTYRIGRNIYSIETADPEGSLKQLTHFESGYVADLEVSYDGTRLLFAHNTLDPEPWFHVYEMKADGSELKQLTFGPYHDVHPNYMPDGRIVFTSSRSGIRDEYHGYPANGLAVMNGDGSDIHLIGYNLGRDAEPVVGHDGKILFTRLELFYSRMKTEWNLLSAFPDGTSPVTLYGPERRDLHRKIKGAAAVSPPRHRAVRVTQPQSMGDGTYLLNTFRGPMIVGPGRKKERFLRPDNTWAVTCPYIVNADLMLVAAGERARYTDTTRWHKPGDISPMSSVDHGLYWMDPKTGDLTLIYNDPETADFEARPLQPRKVPPILPGSPLTRTDAPTGNHYCSSVFITQEPHVKERGKYVRVVEGLPTVARHQTHMNGGIAWRNHGGAIARILGTVPLAADGSFSLDLPSDRLYHFQVLDSDRRVIGNELIWQYVRPSEFKGCVGCHEDPDEAPTAPGFPLAQRQAPIPCMPKGGEMRYRAKMWHKGWAPDEREERMRTVNSTTFIGRN